MYITLLTGKLHQACVTQAELDYEGSCAIDRDLLAAADIHEYEQIQIYNISNGERLTTYAIEAPAGSRTICVNGAAAHKASPGDRIIICAYGQFSRQEADSHKPKVVLLNRENHIKCALDVVE